MRSRRAFVLGSINRESPEGSERGCAGIQLSLKGSISAVETDSNRGCLRADRSGRSLLQSSGQVTDDGLHEGNRRRYKGWWILICSEGRRWQDLLKVEEGTEGKRGEREKEGREERGETEGRKKGRKRGREQHRFLAWATAKEQLPLTGIRRAGGRTDWTERC